MSMKLYYFPGACSLASHIALREAGLTFTLEKVDLDTKRTESGNDFLQVNSKGYVPALVLDDGQVLTETAALLEYIADRKPELGLAPKAGTLQRYRLTEWLAFISSELHKTFTPLWNPRTPEATKRNNTELLARRFDYLSTSLQGKHYVCGDHYTVADVYGFSVLGWCNFLNLDLSKWPVLVAFVARIANRSAVRASLQAEGLIP
jgi:glutathione S-transferase